MKKKSLLSIAIIPFALALLLLSGCSPAGRPGSATDAAGEIKNIQHALKKESHTENHKQRLQLLRDIYDTAGTLTTRWPNDITINLFLEKNQLAIDLIPQTVCSLAVQEGELDSLQWALFHNARLDRDTKTLELMWIRGAEWRALALEHNPEAAMPVFIKQAVKKGDTTFFNQHSKAFLTFGSQLKTSMETAEYNALYTAFITRELKQAMTAGDTERIHFLLDHTVPQSDTPALDAASKKNFGALGDYLLYELKDNELAGKLIALGYPLNPINLETIELNPEFMDLLKEDIPQAIKLFRLDAWHGSLTDKEGRFIVDLTSEDLKLVDRRYIEEIIKLCISKSKTDLALRYIRFVENTNTLPPNYHQTLIDWSIEYANTELFEYFLRENDNIQLHEISLNRLATNQTMFTKYLPRILTHLEKNNVRAADGQRVTPRSVMNEVLMGPNHVAGVYLLETYRLDQQWPSSSDGHTLLMDLCYAGNLPAVKYLVERRRVKLDEKTSFSDTSSDLFGRTEAYDGKFTLMHFAAQGGNSELIQYLAERRVDVNARSHFGVTPLMYAVSKKHKDAVRTLIALKANVNASMDSAFINAPMPEPGSFDQLCTAYRRALTNRDLEMLELLKNAGAQP